VELLIIELILKKPLLQSRGFFISEVIGSEHLTSDHLGNKTVSSALSSIFESGINSLVI